jgi:mannose-6-phosphate isomerase-like protein (cupin superfamily)
MDVLAIDDERTFDLSRHVEKVLVADALGDVSVAYWEPGQVSPYHCHPEATEIYVCLEGEGTMRTPDKTAALAPGMAVVHPPGELHEFENGPRRSVLFRVRYGPDLTGRDVAWRGQPDWRQRADDARYFSTMSEPPPALEDSRR